MKKMFLSLLALCLFPCLMIANDGPIIVVPDEMEVCVSASPNPTNDVSHLAVLTEGNLINLVIIKDLSGNIVFEKAYDASSCDIDLSFLATGDYLMYVTTSSGHCVNRVIVTP